MMDTVSRSLIGLIESNGYRVSIHRYDGKTEATAHILTTDDSFLIAASRDYEVVAELAEQVGIDLEDR